MKHIKASRIRPGDRVRNILYTPEAGYRRVIAVGVEEHFLLGKLVALTFAPGTKLDDTLCFQSDARFVLGPPTLKAAAPAGRREEHSLI